MNNYTRLPFDLYFVDNSLDYNQTGRKTRDINYIAVTYSCNKLEKLLHLSHEMNYEIAYLKHRNVIQINFQETNGAMDWFANIFEFSSKYYDAIEYKDQKLQLRVHHGWANMYRSVKNDIRNKWEQLHNTHPNAETEVIGWSLGASQAILCAQDLNYNFGCKTHLFTYGSVKPFKGTPENSTLMEEYLSTLCKECYNFANINDLITYMPPFKGWMNIRRVTLGTDEKRTIGRLLRPRWYHTIYDHVDLYTELEQETIPTTQVSPNMT